MKTMIVILAVAASLSAEDHHRKFFSQAPAWEFEGGNHHYQQMALLVPVYEKWDFEGNMYRAEGNRVGFIGTSRSVHVGKHLRLHPGVGVLFGVEEPTGVALKLRSFWESKLFVSEGSFIQGLRPSVEHHRDQFAEAHLSLKIPVWQHRHIELGPTGEDIAYKEGKERLAGGRVMIPLGKHLGFTAKVMTHNTFRLGVVWFPSHEK